MTEEIIEHLKNECQVYTAEGSFRDLMDECYPMEGVFTGFHPADILKEMDPTAYNCGVLDEATSLKDRDCVEIEVGVFIDYYDAITVLNWGSLGEATDTDIEQAMAEVEELHND